MANTVVILDNKECKTSKLCRICSWSLALKTHAHGLWYFWHHLFTQKLWTWPDDFSSEGCIMFQCTVFSFVLSANFVGIVDIIRNWVLFFIFLLLICFGFSGFFNRKLKICLYLTVVEINYQNSYSWIDTAIQMVIAVLVVIKEFIQFIKRISKWVDTPHENDYTGEKKRK